MATVAKLRTAYKTAGSLHLDQVEAVVQDGGPTPDREEVSASWRRCTGQLLINPDSPAVPHIVTENELRVFREPLSKAILHAQEEIDRPPGGLRRFAVQHRWSSNSPPGS